MTMDRALAPLADRLLSLLDPAGTGLTDTRGALRAGEDFAAVQDLIEHAADNAVTLPGNLVTDLLSALRAITDRHLIADVPELLAELGRVPVASP